MARISSIQRCRRIPANPHGGRDLVVGDLHGHRRLFEEQLERLDFDPRRDRVFSVGDLVDRGPASLATLALIEEPWFHAVLGNHELMLLNHLGYYSSRLHLRKPYAEGAGQWIKDALSRRRKLVDRLADRLANLPLAIHVAGRTPFNVAHADLETLEGGASSIWKNAAIGVDAADEATTSRRNIQAALQATQLRLRFAHHSIQISERPLGMLPITYVGHSRMRRITVHNSYVYIDQGVCERNAKRETPQPPTVLDHRMFAYWLNGVAVARTDDANERLAAALV